MTCNNHSNKDGGSTGRRTALLEDSGSATDIVNAVAKLIESGASEEDINALIDALNQRGSMAPQPLAVQAGGSGSHHVEAMPFVPLFDAVGKAWQDWGVNETDFDENTFNTTLPLTLVDRLNQAQAQANFTSCFLKSQACQNQSRCLRPYRYRSTPVKSRPWCKRKPGLT